MRASLSATLTAEPGLLQSLQRRYGVTSPAARSGHERYFVNPMLSLDYIRFNTSPARVRLHASSPGRQLRDRPTGTRRARRPFFDGRPTTITSPGHARRTSGQRSIRWAVPTSPRPARLAAGVHADATLLIPAGDPHTAEDAAIVKADLAEIGITIEITPLSGAKLYRRLKTPGDPWDIAMANWGADFADPFTMINELYDPVNAAAADFGHFNDPALTRRMRQAATLSGDSRRQAYAQLDEDLTREDPPSAAWGIGTLRDFFSARAGCQIYQPIYGIDLGSLCLRQ